jgi:hypothetical protein
MQHDAYEQRDREERIAIAAESLVHAALAMRPAPAERQPEAAAEASARGEDRR